MAKRLARHTKFCSIATGSSGTVPTQNVVISKNNSVHYGKFLCCAMTKYPVSDTPDEFSSCDKFVIEFG